MERICKKLGKVFGVSWFGPAIKTKTEMKGIIKATKELAGRKAVRIDAHRSDKEVKFTSHELVSALIKESKKGKIKMETLIYGAVALVLTVILFWGYTEGKPSVHIKDETPPDPPTNS